MTSTFKPYLTDSCALIPWFSLSNEFWFIHFLLLLDEKILLLIFLKNPRQEVSSFSYSKLFSHLLYRVLKVYASWDFTKPWINFMRLKFSKVKVLSVEIIDTLFSILLFFFSLLRLLWFKDFQRSTYTQQPRAWRPLIRFLLFPLFWINDFVSTYRVTSFRVLRRLEHVVDVKATILFSNIN